MANTNIDIKCAVCLDIFQIYSNDKKPCVLECGHALCMLCAKQLSDCPLCHRKFKNVQPNYFAIQFMEILAQNSLIDQKVLEKSFCDFYIITENQFKNDCKLFPFFLVKPDLVLPVRYEKILKIPEDDVRNYLKYVKESIGNNFTFCKIVRRSNNTYRPSYGTELGYNIKSDSRHVLFVSPKISKNPNSLLIFFQYYDIEENSLKYVGHDYFDKKLKIEILHFYVFNEFRLDSVLLFDLVRDDKIFYLNPTKSLYDSKIRYGDIIVIRKITDKKVDLVKSFSNIFYKNQ